MENLEDDTNSSTLQGVASSSMTEAGPASEADQEASMTVEGNDVDQSAEGDVVEEGEEEGTMIVQIDPQDTDEVDLEGSSQEIIMSDPEAGPSQTRKRVKVYELREASWHDRGTGYCKGVYDDAQDIAMLIVEAEPPSGPEGEKVDDEGEGGFLKEDLLLSARVEKEDIYGRQQDTLIVWTEPLTNLDIALSFQDAECCEDIWQFIVEVQRHLNNLPNELDNSQIPSSSSPVNGSPVMGMTGSQGGIEMPMTWEPPTLANVKSQETWIRMQAKSAVGRERAVEHIIGEDYIKQLILVFEQAEDLESLEDLHALCSLMQTILLFNDNTIFEYILADDIFTGVIGMLEYDPDFPTLKASYRQFFQETAKFREVVDIKDANIKNKIHQTYRLLYLKDVVLARVLDDPTFGILNGFVFFNQVDIISHIQMNDHILTQLFIPFQPPATPRQSTTSAETSTPLDERKRDIVLFLHQLMLMGKGVQLMSRLALYRTLLARGILYVCEWALTRHEAQILHAGAEILTLATEHDVNTVRNQICKQNGLSTGNSVILKMIQLLESTTNLGLISQMIDTLRSLLDVTAEENSFVQRKENQSNEQFINYFYDSCIGKLYAPLINMKEIKPEDGKVKLPREQKARIHGLIELLSFSLVNSYQAHRSAYFLLSQPISRKIVSLLYLRDKPLSHTALRYVRTCFRTNNHFIARYFVKNDLLLPVLKLVEEESGRDNMISSTYMEIFEIIRKDNVKPVINHLYDEHRSRMDALVNQPLLRQIVQGLSKRWEANNEPPPTPPRQSEAGSSKTWSMTAEVDEENYFQGSDDEEEIGPKQPLTPAATSTQKRKRAQTNASPNVPTPPPKRPSAPSPGRMATGTRSSTAAAGSSTAAGALGLDYDDGSDSEGSAGSRSPVVKPIKAGIAASSSSTSLSDTGAGGKPITPPEELEEDLGDVAMKMRAKRQREEEEEEGFAGLLVGSGNKSKKKASTPTRSDKSHDSSERSESPSTGNESKAEDSSEVGKKGKGTPGSGKKIKLSLGSFGKKVAGGGTK